MSASCSTGIEDIHIALSGLMGWDEFETHLHAALHDGDCLRQMVLV
jgi:hypothetical protein